MSPDLGRSFEKLERQKAAVLAEIAAWSAARLRFQPEAPSWSALDVLDHLLKVEHAVISAVQASLPDGQPVRLKNRLRAWVVIGVMRSPLRVKVPSSATRVWPGKSLDPSLIAPRWNAKREQMASLLETLSPAQLRRGLFRHPVSGWMTMPQAMAFLCAHLGHHGRQLARLKHASRGM